MQTAISSPKTVTELFPIVGFFQRNIFQTTAAVISIVGILGFSAGKSFEVGWFHAAGWPHAQFPTDAYEFVLQGITLSSQFNSSAEAYSSHQQ